MVRGGDDSDEERHDRFRSERDSSSLKPLSGLGQKRVSTNSTSQDDWRRRDRRSRSRRSKERSSERRRWNVEDISTHKRKSCSVEREVRKKNKHKDRRSPSRDKLKNHRRSRDRSSSDMKSDSYSSHDSRNDRQSYKHSRKRKDMDYDTSISRVEVYVHKFERRRDSSVEEEVVDNHVIYRDSSASPEPSKHRKKRNGEKQKKKEKRKEKKKKKKSKINDKCDEDSNAILVSSDRISINKIHSSKNVRPSLDDLLAEKNDTPLRDVYGPAMPPKSVGKIVGPVVPSSSPEESLPGNRDTLRESSFQSNKDAYGPLPLASLNREPAGKETYSLKESNAAKPESGQGEAEDLKEIRRTYGPELPLRSPLTGIDEDDASYGPALPPRLLKPQPAVHDDDDDDNDGGYGPLPAGLGGRTQEELEIRAALIKRQLGNKEEDVRPKKREEWMTVLPDARRAEFGLGPRQFRAREGPDMSDRSSWTDTPEEKRRREELLKLGVAADPEEDDNSNSKQLGIIARDKEMEKKAREKKKEKSLLVMHQKELKKKKKKEAKERGEKQEERRPFSREVDLQTNRFDEAQKKSIIKKAQLLDSRFSRGESKYL